MIRCTALLGAFWALFLVSIASASDEDSSKFISVEILEGIPDKPNWDFSAPRASEKYQEPAFGFVAIPTKYSPRGLISDRTSSFVLQATGTVMLSDDEYRFLLRTRNAARFWIDGKLVLETKFLKKNSSSHEAVPEVPKREEGMYALPVGHQEASTSLRLTKGKHEFRLWLYVGGQKLRPELGEPCVCIARGGEKFRLLSQAPSITLDEENWTAYAATSKERHRRRDADTRRTKSAAEVKNWQARHEQARQIVQSKPAPKVPAVSATMPAHNDIDRFIDHKLEAKKKTPAPLGDDWTFMRRVYLDTVGVIPTPGEIEAFFRDPPAERRIRAVNRLLADPRWADHWVSYWQDVLAENPGILKPTLNNTGPFRWWIHEAFVDNWPMDRFVTELVRMDGSRMYGGPAGFALATQNDAPMAAKAQIVARAFMGIELACARCHDAPQHPYKQKDTFSLAALLGKGPQIVPATSSVKLAERARRPLIEVTLEPGVKVEPRWPFAELAPDHTPRIILRNPADHREHLAAILTSPENERFTQVIVNRLWKRYLGWGLVEPVDDWHDAKPSHPELLQYLARELATHDYDLKHVARLILNSHTYQRVVLPQATQLPEPSERLFASPARRRLSAEQLVDSLFSAAGKEFHSEELNIDPEGRRPVTEMINLGTPRRAWEFTSLSNERDRPALALPVAQSIVDVLSAFGWRESRQDPVTVRPDTPTPLQPLILANGVVGSRIARLSDDSRLTELSLQDQELSALVQSVFVRLLTRPPTNAERDLFGEMLKAGYASRRVAAVEPARQNRPTKPVAVSWANHLSPEATRIKLEMERAVRRGDPPTARLQPDWRERMEDVVWTLLNSPEFMFVP